MVIGLIPAWAGKTKTSSLITCRFSAHPRVGGENHVVILILSNSQGSSPRGRGKRPFQEVRLEVRRLIPAWAGKTRARLRMALC